MKYGYRLIYPNGVTALSTQNYKFTEQEMLDACKKSNHKDFKTVQKVEFIREIPRGYHLCGCGNLAKGSRDELCDECRETYGHYYEHEL